MSGNGLSMRMVDFTAVSLCGQSVTRRTVALVTSAVVMASVAAVSLLSADAALQPAASPQHTTDQLAASSSGASGRGTQNSLPSDPPSPPS
jgi:hypothetical protein